MKAKYSLAALVTLMLLIVGTVACNRARSDAQIANDVNGKLYADKNVQSRQITVQSSNGVVTLSGSVGSDNERSAAANDAAQVEGVRTVVNNLESSSPTVADAQPAPQPQEQPAAQEPVKAEPIRTAAVTREPRRRPSALRTNSKPEPVTSTSTMAMNTPPPAPVPVAPATPPPPPAPVKVTIPDGTTLSVRMVDGIDSETAQPGQVFRASLDSPIVVDDNVVVPAHADIEGRIVDAKSAGRFAGKSELALELFKLSYNGHTYSLRTNQYSRAGSSRGKTTATRVGTGAAIGAIIGGLAGGGKGAAIGATVGAGAGGGATAVHKGEQIKIDSEQVLVFTLQSPLTVTAASNNDRSTNRRRLED